jgi:hypothetical protein
MVDLFSLEAENVLHQEPVIKSKIKTDIPSFNKAVLHDLYAEKNLSQREIAALFASSKGAVQRALVKHKIPMRERGSTRTHHTHPLACKFSTLM